jgi:hypothetical protein
MLHGRQLPGGRLREALGIFLLHKIFNALFLLYSAVFLLDAETARVFGLESFEVDVDVSDRSPRMKSVFVLAAVSSGFSRVAAESLSASTTTTADALITPAAVLEPEGQDSTFIGFYSVTGKGKDGCELGNRTRSNRSANAVQMPSLAV